MIKFFEFDEAAISIITGWKYRYSYVKTFMYNSLFHAIILFNKFRRNRGV